MSWLAALSTPFARLHHPLPAVLLSSCAALLRFLLLLFSADLIVTLASRSTQAPEDKKNASTSGKEEKKHSKTESKDIGAGKGAGKTAAVALPAGTSPLQVRLVYPFPFSSYVSLVLLCPSAACVDRRDSLCDLRFL